MTSTPLNPPFNVRRNDTEAAICLLAHKNQFFHDLRDTGQVDPALLHQSVTSLVMLHHHSAAHPDHTWRLSMRERVLTHADGSMPRTTC